MKKRNKIMLYVGSFLLILTLTFVLIDGTFIERKYQSVWSDTYIKQLEDDQSKVIAYGIRAASSHNTQPWKVKLIGTDTIELYADIDKTLPVVDGDNKQLLISQGTFIESLEHGAARYGYSVDIEYGEFSNIEPLVASIKLVKSDNLFKVDAISSSTYYVVNLGEENELNKTLDQYIKEYPGLSYTIVESNADVEKLQNELLKGTIIESKDEAATKELLNVFRWTEWEKNKYRYGLSLTSTPGILKPFIQPLIKSTSKNWEGFGDSSIKMFKDRLEQEHRYILIKCVNPGNIDYVHTGQIYQKLIFEIDEYTLKPAMQVLEEYEAMKSINKQFQQEYGVDNEVVLIIGLQNKTNNSSESNPRHLVEDVIIN